MDELAGYSAEVVERCGTCGGNLRSAISQSAFKGRLVWSIDRWCDNCGHAEVVDGWDDMPDELRSMLIEQCGLVRVRVDRAEANPLRVRLMAVFRVNGVGLVEARDAVARLVGEGVTGTDAEMRLLSERLAAVGVTPHLDLLGRSVDEEAEAG
ncbi:hypothetical protein [Virgisporangium aurantiacum]|uniref:Uncharacterized protein n=1 Tax=Virgisporangium aurantiacum TaxID=175570 RepID=A0A8J4E641_9ACTN|nr:hypothetical protein [Virgisporangium aurantiacum]GIJ62814.1 hypothetical protein Vau01_103300 [Virgisporangium aurantiacum]